MLTHANRAYQQQHLAKAELSTSGNDLFRRFVKLVSQHFMTLRKVSDYANLLNPFLFTDEFNAEGKVKVRHVQFDTGAFNAQLLAKK